MGAETIAILGAVTTVMSIAGKGAEGQANANSANFNAAIAEQNAVLARQTAAENERRERVISEQDIASISAQQGASGLTGGSQLSVLASNAMQAELEALTIRHGGELEANAYENEAKLLRNTAENAEKAANLGGLTSLLGGATDTILQMNRVGGSTNAKSNTSKP
jgi:hypothetical protein